MANTTWNPSDKHANITLSGGNLTATATPNPGWVRAVDRQSSGKFYWEVTVTTNASNNTVLGIAAPAANLASGFASIAAPGTCGVNHLGTIYVDGATTGIGLGTITNGTILCAAVDLTARLIWFRLGAAGNWNANAGNNPATGVGGVSHPALGIGIPALPAFYGGVNLEAVTANFGDSAFTGTVPSGFTSGWPTSGAASTNALATQVAIEHWASVATAAASTQGARAMVLA